MTQFIQAVSPFACIVKIYSHNAKLKFGTPSVNCKQLNQECPFFVMKPVQKYKDDGFVKSHKHLTICN